MGAISIQPTDYFRGLVFSGISRPVGRHHQTPNWLRIGDETRMGLYRQTCLFPSSGSKPMRRRWQEIHSDRGRRPELINAIWKRPRPSHPTLFHPVFQQISHPDPSESLFHARQCNNAKRQGRSLFPVPLLTESASPPRLFRSRQIILGARERPPRRTETRATILSH